MKWLKNLVNPLVALIGIQLVWTLLVIFWIYWFVGRHKEFRELAERYRPELLAKGFSWMVLAEGLLLLVIILVGVYVIFVYWQRQSKLYQRQQDFISQVTHELKSPLASIKLHVETIRLRKPPPDKLERFLDTMLVDIDRLDNLISNFLMAAKLEQRRRAPQYPVTDFSAFVKRYLDQLRTTLPEGGSLTLEIEPGIRAAIDPEGMEMALRNLFENAVLYSSASPEIRVCLKRKGSNCLLSFQDRGRGIEQQKELKDIFKMFYRIRQPGETIRGTGIGLYIVKTVVREHQGTIIAASEGIGKGTTFHITLPVAP